MKISENISNNIKRYRKEQSLSQEALAERLGVTAQAVSKWECMQSIPDIEALVEISELLGISLDKLVLDKDAEVIYKEVTDQKEPVGENNSQNEELNGSNGDEHFNRKGLFKRCYFDALPDDDELRVLQFKGRLMLSEKTYNKNAVIRLALDREFAKKKTIHVRIVGNAHIEGEISGNVNAGDNLSCGNVSGSVRAGDSVSCGNVGGSVDAGDSANCGNVGGSVRAGDSVSCGDVGGSVRAGDGVNCGNVNGNVVASDGVRCGDVKVIQRCGGAVHCKSVQSYNGKVHIKTDE